MTPDGPLDFNPQYCAIEAIRLYQQALDFGKTRQAAQADALQGIAEAERTGGEVPKHYPSLADDPGLPPGWAPDAAPRQEAGPDVAFPPPDPYPTEGDRREANRQIAPYEADNDDD